MKKYLFVMLMENKKPLDGGVVERHVGHLKKLDDAGCLVLCGPFSDYGGGMVVVRAPSREEADKIFRSDPFVSEGYKTYQLRTLEAADKSNGFLPG